MRDSRPNQSQSACAILDKSHPAQFISFERVSESDIYLRLHNNSTCPIIVEADDHAPLKSGAGRFVGLHYMLHQQTSRVAYGWGDSVFTVDMSDGDSVTFAVPLAHVRKRFDVAVPFVYAWEGDRVGAGFIGGVNHYVYFLSDDVPANVLKRK